MIEMTPLLWLLFLALILVAHAIDNAYDEGAASCRCDEDDDDEYIDDFDYNQPPMMGP